MNHDLKILGVVAISIMSHIIFLIKSDILKYFPKILKMTLVFFLSGDILSVGPKKTPKSF
jgi:hypothetical protein